MTTTKGPASNPPKPNPFASLARIVEAHNAQGASVRLAHGHAEVRLLLDVGFPRRWKSTQFYEYREVVA